MNNEPKKIKLYILIIIVMIIITLIAVISLAVWQKKNEPIINGNNSTNTKNFSDKNEELNNISNEQISDVNKKMAEICYIESSNSEANKIVNKMLDELVKQKTVIIKTENMPYLDGSWQIHADFINYTEKYVVDGEIIEYKDNTEKVNIRYDLESKEYSKTGRKREYMLYELLNYNEFDLFTESHGEGEYYKVSVETKDNNYIVTEEIDAPNIKGKEIYYINKNTFLLEKAKLENSFYSAEFEVTYSNDSVNIPKTVKTFKEKKSLDKGGVGVTI